MEEREVILNRFLTTAHDEYLLEAFRTHGIAYLLKPVKPEESSSAGLPSNADKTRKKAEEEKKKKEEEAKKKKEKEKESSSKKKKGLRKIIPW